MATTGLCSTCTNSSWCPTWSEYKCLKKEIRFTCYGFKQPTKCTDYVKRGKDFKERKCQCEDCLKNDLFLDEYEES